MDKVMNILDRDHDGDLDLDDIYALIIDLMRQESKNKDINGINKKYNVMKNIQIVLGDSFQRYEPFIDKTIDFIFQIAQNSSMLKFLKKRCYCFKK